MKKLEIYKTSPGDMQPKLLATYEVLESGELKAIFNEQDEAATTFINNMSAFGAEDVEGEQVFPKDGTIFLEALKDNFKSPWMYVKEIND